MRTSKAYNERHSIKKECLNISEENIFNNLTADKKANNYFYFSLWCMVYELGSYIDSLKEHPTDKDIYRWLNSGDKKRKQYWELLHGISTRYIDIYNNSYLFLLDASNEYGVSPRDMAIKFNIGEVKYLVNRESNTQKLRNDRINRLRSVN